MRMILALIGFVAAGAGAQPLTIPRGPAPLTTAQRDARIGKELKAFAGRPLAGPFSVGPGRSVPTPVRAFSMDMVRGTIADSTGGLALFLTAPAKTAVDVQRPMVTVQLKAHAKPYLVDCALGVQDPAQQIAYYDAAEPTYHSKIIEKKSTAAVQDGHALFAVQPATADHWLFVGPIALDPTKAWSMSFTACTFSTVG